MKREKSGQHFGVFAVERWCAHVKVIKDNDFNDLSNNMTDG